MVKHPFKHRNTEQNKAVSWLALVIGNTRLHWGHFYQENLIAAWHTPHLTQAAVHQLQQAHFQSIVWQTIFPKTEDVPAEIEPPSELWIASAVPQQTALWLAPTMRESLVVQTVERSHIPLANIYPTLGIDRAINLLGAGQVSGWPTVVIDGGTALTFTAGIEKTGMPSLYGGAILPGLRLQRESLAQKTAVLGRHIPVETQTELNLPARWAMETESAIASGLTYSVTATLIDYLTDWWVLFPNGKAILTGGDALSLHHYLQQRTPELASRVLINHDLMFYGMQAYRKPLISAKN